MKKLANLKSTCQVNPGQLYVFFPDCSSKPKKKRGPFSRSVKAKTRRLGTNSRRCAGRSFRLIVSTRYQAAKSAGMFDRAIWQKRKRAEGNYSNQPESKTEKTILNFAVDNDWLSANPVWKTRGTISTAAEVERERVLSFVEEHQLLAACVGEKAHVKPILMCALDTAMRRGETTRTEHISRPQRRYRSRMDSPEHRLMILIFALRFGFDELRARIAEAPNS